MFAYSTEPKILSCFLFLLICTVIIKAIDNIPVA